MAEINALVPMRHHSQRVPEKNFRLLAGKPLYTYILSTLLRVPEISRIYVNTDSPVLKEGIPARFPSVHILERPEALSGDEVSMNKIIEHDTGLVSSDYYLQTHSTNPLLKPQTISRAIEAFLTQKEVFDSLFSVTKLQTRLYNQQGAALNHNPGELIQTQDLPPVYEENSCLYLFSKSSLEANQHRIGRSPLMFEIDPEEAWDIDTMTDFMIVEFLIGQSKG